MNYYRWRRIQRDERSKENGRLIGIGLGAYLEISAWAPGYGQTASLNVTQTGRVKVVSGTSPHGQGHETPLAQIAADELGIDIERITVTYGRYGSPPLGFCHWWKQVSCSWRNGSDDVCTEN